jgi:hypothetical protein
MKPWFKNVTPHRDIREGNLDESVFAANLTEVAFGTANEIYSNSEIFFSKTFFTAGLKTICKRVIRGLQGNVDSGDRILSLQTGFGGGKTHALITVYHCAKLGIKLNYCNSAKEIVSESGEISFENTKIAVFTNKTTDAAQGRKVDGIHIRTMWGEIAYQLAGKAGYEIIKQNDDDRVCPKGLFKQILEMSLPCLILIDELADYCVAASAVRVENSTLADQTISFIQELSEAVQSVQNCVLIATLPASAMEVSASQIGAEILNALSNRLSRVSADTTPVNDEEIFEVVRRRLFEDIGDKTEIEKTAADYLEMYNKIKQEIPVYAIKPDYRDKIIKSYPFHPELIEMFHIRWSSHPDFQRTRGVLKLLASIISDLWKRQNSLTGENSLIQCSDVYFANLDSLSSQLKKLYGNDYGAVISGDVSGSGSNAFRIDSDVKEYGDYNLAQGIASTIILGSFGRAEANKGISIKELKLCVMKPNAFNHNSVNAVLDRLEENAHFLYYSTVGVESKHYWFHTKPNINILINQAKSELEKKVNEIHKEIIQRLDYKKSLIKGFNVLIAPSDDIPEQLKPTLVFLYPKFQVNGVNKTGNAGEEIKKLATKKGSGVRVYRNTILFVVCSENGYTNLKGEILQYLACTNVKSNYNTQLEADQKEEIRKRIEQANQGIEKTLCSAYNVIFKSVSATGIERLDIKQYKDTIDGQVNDIFLKKLIKEEWLIESIGLTLLKNNNLFPDKNTPIKAKDVYEAFISYDDKPIIYNIDSVQKSLLKFCLEGEFAIASGEQDNYSRIYYRENVPYFDVTQQTYWLVDKSMYIETQLKPDGNQPPVTPEYKQEDSQITEQLSGETEKKFKSIKISGKVPIENWSNVFTYFIQPLITNKVEASIEIRAKSTDTKPLTENSPAYKQAKENAKQLGLNFEEE